jgi:hypothetical protein
MSATNPHEGTSGGRTPDIPYSHSMVLSDDNALVYQRNFFCMRQRTDSTIRQKFGLLISKANFDDPRFARFQRLSVSIGRFSASLSLGVIANTILSVWLSYELTAPHGPGETLL